MAERRAESGRCASLCGSKQGQQLRTEVKQLHFPQESATVFFKYVLVEREEKRVH